MLDPWTIAADYGLAALLIATFFIGLLREWWVLGRELRAEREGRRRDQAESDYWRALALSGTELAKVSMELSAMEQRRYRD